MGWLGFGYGLPMVICCRIPVRARFIAVTTPGDIRLMGFPAGPIGLPVISAAGWLIFRFRKARATCAPTF